MTLLRTIGLSIIVGASAASAVAQEYRAGGITVERPWARATPKGAPVGGGYLVIRNDGAAPDQLVSASAEVAGVVEIHQMSMTGGVMRMRPLTAGLPVPAKGQVELSPKGSHLMFMNLKRPLIKGESIKGALTFEHAGTVPITFEVGGMGDAGPKPR
jgi:copper(I)-binding protein